MGEIDILRAPVTDLRPASTERLDLELDLGKLSLASQTSESFDDLIAREQYRCGNLPILDKCRLVLREGGTLRLTNPNPLAAEPGYLELAKLLLSKAGFVDLLVRSRRLPTVVEARKRPTLAEEHEYGMVLRELTRPEEILRFHEFTREQYFNHDFNYDLDVARQFDPNSDTYAVFDGSGGLLAVGRVIRRMPGYNCPFMHAVVDDGTHFRIPDSYRRVSEVMGLFKEGKAGVVGFKKLMEWLTQYAYHVAKLDSIWTTYDAEDPYTGSYYKSKLLMEEVGVRLTYRDFGGKWNLICTNRILELRDLHRDIFKS